ncbi:MAG: Rne/Rng family ribonuclease [Deltaproteobacteria bacterium]|nr:Rne/Rng family ribonuclease [Deltaproteobacteria bacterium]
MANELIMNVTPGETRIARLEDGILSELSIERDSELQVAGNIYHGRINRVLPGMQAAFVDIGLEKAAFLYVADVVSDLFSGMYDDDVDEIGKNGDNSNSQGEEDTNEEADTETEATDPKTSGNKDARYPHNNRFRNQRQPRHRRPPLPRIEDVVKEGQSIVVQVAKEPIRTKGARVTCHISLPGRYLVYMPTVNHVGVSRRINSYEERTRLKEVLRKNKPAAGGFIARTSCVGASEEKLVADMQDLKDTWQKIYEKQEKTKPPSLLHADLDIVLRAARDNLSGEIERLVIDSKEHHHDTKKFISEFMPDLANRVEFYNRDTPIFDAYGIESEINRALGKKIWLKSGGYLIIDSSEALTSIDINTGRFVGKKDFEETVLTTNLEAVEEISYQLKLRSIGGIIIIDFIDMNRYAHRMRVYHTLKEALRRDRVKTTISKISDLGLVEMTRKRTRDSLTQMLSTTCEHCQGTGFVKTPITVAFETFREIKRVFGSITSRSLLLRTNPKVAKILFNEGRNRLEQIERQIGKRIVIESDEKFHLEQYEIRGRNI